ncbi:MAG: glycosyltransferase family 4 protein [Candidatus Brocadiaceae bacterium]|nr:glycosyltransferase family 4 protein [Candidatus Brocadiaceae bacterium]
MEIAHIINKLSTLSIFNRKIKDRVNVFISIIPSSKGGGSNTFAYSFKKWLLNNKDRYNLVYNIQKADKAIVIADKMDVNSLEKARCRECFIIHRLDEHVESNEDDYRKKKHSHIKELNAFADVTVYQSRFVFNNMHPFLGFPERYEIILNGADTVDFYPADKPGEYIGHATWGVGDKKRMDIVYDTIKKYTNEQFLLIGNHSRSGFDFSSLTNVRCIGQVKRQEMLSFLHQMKFLFFPSENDPCPNTVIESIQSGIPVCYNPIGGTKEVVQDCGLPISDFEIMLKNYLSLRQKCLSRQDLNFNTVADKYMDLN